MMRKGDLAEYPPEWVLRTAAQEGVDGGIEFDVGRPISVFLTGGRVYLVIAEGDPDEPEIDQDLDDHAFAVAVETTEHRLLPHAIGLIQELLGATSGEYFHHPLNEHALMGEWDWDTIGLLEEAARRIQQDEAAERAAEAQGHDAAGDDAAQHTDAPVEGAVGSTADDADVPDEEMIRASDVPASGEPEAATTDAATATGPATDDAADAGSWGDDSLVRLTGEVPTGEVTADGWVLIAAMADTIPAPILASRLGWSEERMAEVLDGLRGAGAVAEGSFDAPAFTPPASALG